MAAPSGKTPVLNLRYPTPDDDVDVPRDIQALATDVEAFVQGFIGELRMFGFATPPARWLACDGTVLAQSAYPELFAKIGATWNTGGETGAQFRLPSLSGRALVGAGAGAGLTSRTVATRWGVEAVVLALTQLPSHNHGGGVHAHSISDPGHQHSFTGSRDTASGFTATILGAGGFAHITAASGTGIGIYNSGTIIGSDGGGQSHDNTQPSIAVPIHIYAGR